MMNFRHGRHRALPPPRALRCSMLTVGADVDDVHIRSGHLLHELPA